MLIQPSEEEDGKMEAVISEARSDEYDMDIINKLYRGKVQRIPQWLFNLITGEFRWRNYAAYLGSRPAKWDPDAVLKEARFMRVSNLPIPKPWMRVPKDLLNKRMPKCPQSEWLKFYYDFAMRRKAVCGEGFELQSQELPPDSTYRQGRWFHANEVG